MRTGIRLEIPCKKALDETGNWKELGANSGISQTTRVCGWHSLQTKVSRGCSSYCRIKQELAIYAHMQPVGRSF